MIDIHSHILPFVDDGAKSIEESLAMLKIAEKQGITKIILTPHFDTGMKQKTDFDLYESYQIVKDLAKKENINIEFSLGHEVSFYPGVSKEIKNGNALPLNNSQYVLLELTHHTFLNEVDEAIYEMQTAGYKTIIAHLERYGIYNPRVIRQYRQNGALIQINATAFFVSNNTIRKALLKLVKLDLIDFIASDQHFHRDNRMAECYEMIKKKFGKAKADFLFNDNAQERLFN